MEARSELEAGSNNFNPEPCSPSFPAPTFPTLVRTLNLSMKPCLLANEQLYHRYHFSYYLKHFIFILYYIGLIKFLMLSIYPTLNYKYNTLEQLLSQFVEIC